MEVKILINNNSKIGHILLLDYLWRKSKYLGLRCKALYLSVKKVICHAARQSPCLDHHAISADIRFLCK